MQPTAIAGRQLLKLAHCEISSQRFTARIFVKILFASFEDQNKTHHAALAFSSKFHIFFSAFFDQGGQAFKNVVCVKLIIFAERKSPAYCAEDFTAMHNPPFKTNR